VVLGHAPFTVVGVDSGDGRLGAPIVEVAKRACANDHDESSIAVRGRGGVGNLGVAVPVVGGTLGTCVLSACTPGASIIGDNVARSGRRRRCRADRPSRRRGGCHLV
jgi:hypothetical protein